MPLLERSLYFLHNDGRFLPLSAGHHPLSPSLCLTLVFSGDLDPESQFLINIRQVDTIAWSLAAPLLNQAPLASNPSMLLFSLFRTLSNAFKPLQLLELQLRCNPFSLYSAISCSNGDPMLLIHRRYEFSASHRLYNPQLTDAKNQALFGKCSNPEGHGHNYEFELAFTHSPDHTPDFLMLDKLVQARILNDFDHKHLNKQVPEFQKLIPTVENIARVLFERLNLDFPKEIGGLAKVKVWETPKTSAEYSLGPIDMLKY